jgi:2-phosphosulfolactate phosphatase
MSELRVHYLPQEIERNALAGSAVVVIDLLRATSTICQALAAGAVDVVPFLEVDEARAAAAVERAKLGHDSVVLGGERHGKLIAGFDLGNSPSEYTLAVIRGKRLFLSTTNGTRALDHARQAKRVLCGSFLNLSALKASIEDEPQVDILCAGTDGQETLEDILAAGAIVDSMFQQGHTNWSLNQAAQDARDEWQILQFIAERADRKLSEWLAEELRDTPGGRNLLEIGMDHDLVDCAQIDTLSVVPELHVTEWRITSP